MGGNGVSSSISGSATTYAVGGNAGGATSPGVPGNSNTGNGGNGGKNSQSGGNGGSGVVIISYTTGAMNATGGTITTSGGNTIHTFTSGGTFTVGQPTGSLATVTTPTATSITSTGATLGANVTSDGGATLTAVGTCWGTSAAPTTNCTAQGTTSTGVFTQARTGLPSSSTIYYRGYATNSIGTSYSPDGTFSTPNFELQPDPVAGQDTYYGTVYTTNGSPDNTTMSLGGWGDAYYDFIEFDLTGSPSAAVTTSAEIWLWGSRPSDGNDPGLQINRVNSAWTEASVTYSSHPSYTYYGNAPAFTTDGSKSWIKLNITNLYKDWKNGVYSNYGIALNPTNTNHTNGDFYSSDNADSVHRPKLVVYQ